MAGCHRWASPQDHRPPQSQGELPHSSLSESKWQVGLSGWQHRHPCWELWQSAHSAPALPFAHALPPPAFFRFGDEVQLIAAFELCIVLVQLPTEAAALAIAAEFALQRDQIITASTPLYNLACNAIDGYLDEEIAEQASRKALSGRADDILRKLAAAASDSLGNNAAVEMPTGGEDEWLWSLAEATAAVAADGTQAPLGAVSAVCATSRQLASPVLAGGLSSVYDNEVSKLREVAKDYLETDSACFRVMSGRGMSDHTLRKRQDRAYRPFLDWFRDTYGTELAVMEGFSDSKHPSLAYVGVEDFVDHADHFLRASLAALLGATKSTTISMALLYGHVTLDQALEASRVEEQFQIEENGFVEDGHDTQFVQLRVKAAAAAALMRLAPESGPLSPAGPFAAAAGMPMADASGHGSLTTAGLPAMVARTRLRRVFELAKTEKMQEDARLEQQEVIQARGWDKLSPEELDRRMIQSHLESISQAIPASGSDTR